MKACTKVKVAKLVFWGCHGVNDSEKIEPQPIEVTITLRLKSARSVRSDDLNHTVNWADLRGKIRTIVETESYALIERLNWQIGRCVLAYPRVKRAKVTTRKLHAWSDRNGIPSVVTVYRN